MPARALLLVVSLVACHGDPEREDGGGDGAGAGGGPSMPPQQAPPQEGEGEGEGESGPGDGGAADGAEGEGEGENGEAAPCQEGPEGPGEGPAPRSGARTLYDPPRNRLWMFGGDLERTKPEGEDPRFSDETWELSLCPPRWRRIHTGFNVPNKRGGHGLAHDEAGGRAFVVFGRDRTDHTTAVPVPSSAYEIQGDVWQFDLARDAWSRVRIPGDGDAPDPRHGHSVVYDPSADRLVLFGGVTTGVHVGGCTDLPCAALRADTWFLDLAGPAPAWRELLSETTPPRRQDHAATLDPATGRMVVTGGAYGQGRYHSDVWTLDLASGEWSEADAGAGVRTPGRAWASLSYHPGERALLLFGGRDADGPHNDVYLFGLASQAWTRLGDDDLRGVERPAPRSEAGFAHLVDDRFALFGGEGASSLAADVWEFESASRGWRRLAPLP